LPVFLSAGHSDQDPGAISGGLKEADLTILLRDVCARVLRACNVEVITDGPDHQNLSLPAAITQSRKTAGPKIEFHFNAAANSKAGGCEALCLEKDVALASQLVEAVCKASGLRNRGVKPPSESARKKLGWVTNGGIILEIAFITNPADIKLYQASLSYIVLELCKVILSTQTKKEPTK
jgi:N-acetylmuramoyl-L-alanine amidase